jgi:galactokinase
LSNKLINKVKQVFQHRFRTTASTILLSPGRINLIGEHTDYNNGLVLPAAINRYMVFAMSLNGLGKHRIYAMDVDDEIQLELHDFNKSDHSWTNYFIGILKEFHSMSHMSGIDCCFASDIPIGAGLSSSSAMECGFMKGLNHLFHLNLTEWEMINISQRSNHDFLGIQGGIMDQFACFYGKADHAMMLDCRDSSHTYVPIHLPDHQFVLFDTKVSHDHLTSKYNERVAECRRAVDLLAAKHSNLKTLRDVDEVMLKQHGHLLNPISLNRAKFVVQENRRVELFMNALRESDIQLLGSILTMSHLGLQRQYEVSCKELDLMVDLALPLVGVLGARMMGGGFGGCTLNLMEKEHVDHVIFSVLSQYKKRTGTECDAYIVKMVEGAQVVLMAY